MTIKRKTILVKVILGILILIINCRNIFILFGPVTGVDDIGYWGTGYYIAFGEVKECLSLLSYYSYGYSLILAPLIRIISSGEMLFKCVVVLNAVMNLISFYLSIYVVRSLSEKISEFIIVICCFISAIYIGNVFYSSFMLAESFLIMMCWVLFGECASLVKQYTFWKVILAQLTLVVLHCIHQRSIAVIVPVLIFLVFLMIRHEKNVRKYLVFGCSGILVLCISLVVKNGIADTVFRNGAELANNDYSGNISKISSLLSISGIGIFLRDFLVKLFCFNFSTLLVGGIGLFFFIFETYKLIRNKGLSDKAALNAAIIFSFIFAICINVIFTINGVNRFEGVIYGRYIEYLYGIFIATGLLSIYRNVEYIYQYLIILVGASVIGGYCVCAAIKQYSFSSGIGLWLAPSFFRIFEESENLVTTTLLCIKIVMLIGILIFFLVKGLKRNRVSLVVLSFLLIGFWGENLKALDKDYIYYQDKFESECRELCEKISELNEDVYYIGENCDAYRIREMQFMVNDIQFKMMDSEEMMKMSNELILVNKYGKSTEIIDTDVFDVKYENDVWILVEKMGNKNPL